MTSAAVTPDSYRVICQATLVVAEFQLKIAAEATRELDAWRFDPRSFKFAVYGRTEQNPYKFNILNRR